MNNSINTNTTKNTEITSIINALVKQVMEGEEYPYQYSVAHFGFWDDFGKKLPPSIIRQFYDKEEVKRTCRIIKNSLKETFGMNAIWCFTERHSDLLDEDGTLLKSGRFHINIISSQITDSTIEEPNRKIKRLLLDNGRMDIPIKDGVYADLDELKIALVDACIKRASDWVNRFQYSVKTQLLLEPIDLDTVARYCLKDYEKQKPFGNRTTDFTDVVCFAASDFYKP